MSSHEPRRAPGAALLADARRLSSGALLAAVIAFAAAFIAETRGGPTMLYALLLGMALHSVTAEGGARPGVDFAARRVLRVGVALLGARITLEQISGLGWGNVGLILAGVGATIAFGVVVSGLMGLDRRLGFLTGGATAICGASAAIAIAALLPRDEKSERELIFTIAGVTVLSTVAMIVYPMVVHLLRLTPEQAGIFLGGTIHDVAQVVGAGYSVSNEVGDYAVLTKMLRVAMLLPVVLALSVAAWRRTRTHVDSPREPLLPPFLVAFVLLVTANSLGAIPRPVGATLNELSRGCLIVAMAAVGLKTSLLDIRKVGLGAAFLLGAEAVFLVAFVLLAQVF